MNSPVSDNNASTGLRSQLRQMRRVLDVRERQFASLLACEHIVRHRWFRSAHRVALYMPMAAEIDPLHLIAHSRAGAREFFVPVLGYSSRLLFAPLNTRHGWRKNRFGIAEPRLPAGQLLRPASLDLVITPLVGFDASGNRLGAGGGFYDRSFAFRHHRGWGRPRLLGIAFELQRCLSLQANPWDVALDAVATEAGLREFDN